MEFPVYHSRHWRRDKKYFFSQVIKKIVIVTKKIVIVTKKIVIVTKKIVIL